MRTAAISDVHVKMGGGPGEEVLRAFLAHPLVRESGRVVFLGDVFDLMIGPYPEYVDDYAFFFDWARAAIAGGKHVHYFEGNHDFHLGRLMAREVPGARYLKGHEILEIFGRLYYFSHGDDIEIGNPSYKAYKSLINNAFMEMVARYAVPYSWVRAIGERASRASRERNTARYAPGGGQEGVKENFRRSALAAIERYGVDAVICGHSHVREDFEAVPGRRYLNNGYAPATRCFTYIDEKGVRSIDL